MSLNVTQTVPQTQNTNNNNLMGGFDMNLLGFGGPTTQTTQQPINNQFIRGNNLIGNDFLGLGTTTSQPVQSQPQNLGGFNWGTSSQPTTNQNQNQSQVQNVLAY
jgi:hypothetical protein